MTSGGTEHPSPPAWRIAALGLCGLVLVTYVRPLLLGETFVGRDFMTMAQPSREFLAQSIARGQIPEWWDAVGLGAPFAANPNHGVFYPPAWIVTVLPTLFATTLLPILHVLWAGIGMFFLSRRLGACTIGSVLAGGVFMTSGLAVSLVMHVTPLLTLAWMPWVAWGADRAARAEDWPRRLNAGVALAALMAAQILSGDPALAITTDLVALGVVVTRARRRWPALGIVCASAVAGALMAAVVVVPALHLLDESTRAGGLDLSEGGVWSMHPLRMLEWIWPHALGDSLLPQLDLARVLADSSNGRPGLGPGWALSLYIGAPVLLLAGYAAAAGTAGGRKLAVLSAVFVLLALGTYTPLYGWFRQLWLPEQLVRYPEKHVAGALVLWSALAGVGFSRLVQTSISRRLVMAASIVVALIGTGVAVVAAVRSSLEAHLADRAAHLDHSLDVAGALESVLSGGVMAVVVSGVVLGAIVLRRHKSINNIVAWILPVVLCGHLVAHAWSVLPLADREVLSQPPAIVGAVLPADEPTRPRLYWSQAAAAWPAPASAEQRALELYAVAVQNSAARFGFAYVPGYQVTYNRRLQSLWNVAFNKGRRFVALYDIRYAIMPPLQTVPPWLTPLARGHNGVVLFENRGRRPRAFVASRWAWLPDDAAVGKALFGRAPPDPNAVRLSGEGRSQPTRAPEDRLSPCTIRSERPEHVVLRCSSRTGGYAVLLDQWAPGWSATVDGRPAAIVRADMVARAVAVPSGAHRIVFRYRTPGLRGGAVCSAVAWSAWLVLLWVARRWLRRGRST